MDTIDMKGFSLGEPALVCRWRLSGGKLPLENRHLRALSHRKLDGNPVSKQLVAWVKQNVEWALKAGSAENPDGVLMLVVDARGHAAMTVGPYERLARTTAGFLCNRALDASREAESSGVAPESLWVIRGSCLVVSEQVGWHPAGVTSLVEQLAKTLGLQVVCQEDLIAQVLTGMMNISEGLFLASDEHGVVVARDAASPRAERLAGAYARLLEKSR